MSNEPRAEAVPVTDPGPEIRIADNPERHRYEAWAGDDVVGFHRSYDKCVPRVALRVVRVNAKAA